MISKELLELLNNAIARELQVCIQYMWQSIEARGIKGAMAKDVFRKTAMAEMKHAEQIAKRLHFLGGDPTTEPSEVTVGESLEEMLREDVRSEKEAVEMYRDIIDRAEKEGDVSTRKLFEDILAEEETHLDDFQSMLEE